MNDQITRTVKNIFVQSKNDRDLLSQYIDKYLIPAAEEKSKNAEVSTPYKLRQEMLDTIPKDFWKSVKRVFEPCCGKGGFVIDILNRFLKAGIDEKTAIEECIFFADINPLNVFVTKLLLDPEGKYKVNAFLGDTLKMKFDFKFDAVIGNPPYNANQTSQGNTPLYNVFIDKFIDECKYLLFVIPSRWFAGGKGLDRFRSRMLERTDIKLIQHESDCTKWFPRTDIKGGVNYFLKDSDHDGVCMFNDVPYQLNKYDCLIDPKFHDIIDLVKEKQSVVKIFNTANYFKCRTNDSRLLVNGTTECFVSTLKAKSRIMYLNDYEMKEKDTFWKVITARAAHKGGSGFAFVGIGRPDQIHTDSYISFKVSSQEEADSLKSYLETRFANLMLSMRKISQDINSSVIKWIPLVPFDRTWSDEEVFKYFEFTEDQIRMIEDLY